MADFNDDDDALLAELGVEVVPKKAFSRTPREERIIAGFEEVQRFFDEHGHAPRYDDTLDIFERLYAVRLDRLRDLAECREILEPLIIKGFCLGKRRIYRPKQMILMMMPCLLNLVWKLQLPASQSFAHVRSSVEKRAAEEIANRDKCEDFETFKPIFEQVQKELNAGIRTSRPFELKAEIRPGSFFIVSGQKAYVAEMDEVFTNAQGRTDARLRVIFDNGTQSNMLMRSLQRSLNKDEAGRRITDPTAGPLFADHTADGDEASGTIYVLRSKSDHPTVAANRELVHKIGVTNMRVKQRIAAARLQPTFLLADVEVVATYELYNINRTKLEKLIHRIFDGARLDIEISDRFGNPVVPREWFLVPLFAIDEAVEKIRDGTISNHIYDPQSAKLIERQGQ